MQPPAPPIGLVPVPAGPDALPPRPHPVRPPSDPCDLARVRWIRPAGLGGVVDAYCWRAGDVVLYARNMQGRAGAISVAQRLAGCPPFACDVIHVGIYDGAGRIWDVTLFGRAGPRQVGAVFRVGRHYGLRRPYRCVDPHDLAAELQVLRGLRYTCRFDKIVAVVAVRVAQRVGLMNPNHLDLVHRRYIRQMTICTVFVQRCLLALGIEVDLRKKVLLPADFFDAPVFQPARPWFHRA